MLNRLVVLNFLEDYSISLTTKRTTVLDSTMSDTTDHDIQGTKVAVQQVDNLHPDVTGVHVVKRIHADGTVDLIDAHAIGGDLDEMPVGYFLTPNFICTFLVSKTTSKPQNFKSNTYRSQYVLPVSVLILDGCFLRILSP